MTSVRRVTVVVALALALTLTPVVAADDWPDDCDGEFVQPATSVHAGQLDSAADADALEFELDRGDYVTVGALTDRTRGTFRVEAFVRSNSGGIVVRETSLEPAVQLRSGDRSTGPGEVVRAEFRGNATGSNSTWQLRATEDASVCIVVSQDSGSYPTGWEVSLNENAPERNPLSRASVATELTARDQEIDRLRETVSEQNRTIERLRSQIANGTSIDVTVSPANESAAFVAGSTALVRIESDTVPVEDVVVTYGDTITSPDENGRLAVPLEDPGTQQIQFIYRDAEETVLLDVQERPTTGTTGATATPTPTERPSPADGATGTTDRETTEPATTGTTGPGFGGLLAIVAVSAALFLLARRDT